MLIWDGPFSRQSSNSATVPHAVVMTSSSSSLREDRPSVSATGHAVVHADPQLRARPLAATPPVLDPLAASRHHDSDPRSIRFDEPEHELGDRRQYSGGREQNVCHPGRGVGIARDEHRQHHRPGQEGEDG